MVDVGAIARNARQAREDAERGVVPGALTVDLRPADDVALADYEAFCKNAVHAQAQHPLWIRSWVMNTGADAFIVTIQKEGRPFMMLALEVVNHGPFRIAAFPGGPHANGNFVSLARDADGRLTSDDIAAVRRALSEARPDIDLIALDTQAPDFNGMSNPWAPFATMPNANTAFATDLRGGMNAMLERMNGKRKRKKYRYQLRKYEDAGGYRWIEATSPDEIDHLIDAFYAMKSARFRKRGISDPFGTAEVQAFFRQLFQDAQSLTPAPFLLHAVEVGGEIRGVNGYSVTDHSLVCEFCAIRDDDPAMSPGFFLDYIGMEKACERGKAIYDFSVGEDDYKHSWCDIQTQPFDVLLPLNAKGHLAKSITMARSRIVGALKSNRRVWAMLKKLRTRIAGSDPTPST